MRHTLLLLPLILLLVSCNEREANPGTANKSSEEKAKIVARPFAWPMDQDNLPTRGGTSQGAPVSLSPSPSKTWTELVAMPAGIERDRAAIKAIIGNYRTAFDFQEIVGYRPSYKLSAPYFSWATERVFLIEETPTKIVLQHQLVMRFAGHPGAMVVKHWRQDWTYEDPVLLRYLGHATWKRETINKEDVTGCWTQTVYGVGDEPRYSSYGRWRHDNLVSSWTGSEHWRPRPRREKSVRDDYELLEGYHRISILPDGWTLFQDNRKVVMDEKFVIPHDGRVANELGFERYQRLDDFDWSDGEKQWEAEKQEWAAIRKAWDEVLSEPQVTLYGEENVGKTLLETVMSEPPGSGAKEVKNAVVKPKK